MKKIVSIIIATICLATCIFALAACGESGGAPQYYGKTITFTGNALPISWDKKCQKDNGPDNSFDESKHDFVDSKYYSYRELLTKYWSRVDFEHDDPEAGDPWAEMKGKTVEQFIAEINSGIAGFYDRWMNLSEAIKLEFGSKTDRNLKITTVKEGETTVYNTKFVETQAQLEEEKSKFDPKANYLEGAFLPQNEGRNCLAFIDSDNDGKYDGYISIALTAYVVNDNKPTVDLQVCRKSGVDELDGTYYSDGFSFAQINARLALWAFPTGNGATSILSLPFYPEIVIA